MEKQKRSLSFAGIAIISASLMLAAGCSSKENSDAQMTSKATPMESMAGMEGMTSMESMEPSMNHSMAPTEVATQAPTVEPTMAPMTANPTVKPSILPTAKPTVKPTVKPAPTTPPAKPTDKPMATMDHSTMATSPPTKSPASSDQTFAISIKTFAFSPNAMTIPVNSEITFTNKDDVKHTVTAKDGSFRSELLAQDQSYSHKFTETGTYEIYCEPHTFMTATITVE